MNLYDFDFTLPEELIAQEPSSERDHSRLMVVNRDSGNIQSRLFYEIIDYLKSGDLLVVNDTRVFPARLIGKKATGGKVEIFLLEKESGIDEVWECLVGGKRARPGTAIVFNDLLKGEILEDLGEGRFRVLFHCNKPFDEILEETGQVPLPPYIKRAEAPGTPPLHPPLNKGGAKGGVDKERYQTVFADRKGAVAAPTAGLHFTESLLDKIRGMGVEIVTVTLHVGPGTFIPVKVENIEEHRMMPEWYEISEAAAEKINRAKAEGRRVIAVGSTSMRTLEAAATPLASPLIKGRQWGVVAGNGRTSIFIYPGYAFKVVNALVTNFHLPKSTLIMLVSAFAGRELVLKVYKEAIEQRYRFYSYGDAMMIIF